MHRLKVERVALLALLLGAALLAPGYALAADEHGHSAPATATATEQHEAAPADAHQADPAEAPATDHAHGEPAEAGHVAAEHPATDGHTVDAAHVQATSDRETHNRAELALVGLFSLSRRG